PGVSTHEFFAAASPEQAIAAVRALGSSEVHLVATAREPLGLFTASWQESLKNRNTGPLPEYGPTVSKRPSTTWNWRPLDLRLVLRRWAPPLPPEHVHVLPLHRGGRREAIWETFAGLVGADAAAYDTAL